ncbi:hypothetical protein FQA39_LY01674 [Lamprigera yunnana]|nr:hypothetical protein FQA39_LY01674 [Lamprigera yunnana]
MGAKVILYCVVIVLLPITSSGADLRRGQQCRTPNKEAAQCVPLNSCPVILNAILTQNQTSIKFAQQSQCGYDTEPLICCGSVAFPSPRGSTCTTPNEEIGTCLHVSGCKVFHDALKSRDAAAIEFSKKSHCGFDTEQLICCGTTARPFEKRILEHPRLPSSKICGFEKSTDRVYGGQITDKDELPWMALLRYNNKDGTDAGFKCGGTLISKRYILTAAHCVLINTYYGFSLVSVRLGEWRISTEKDCEEKQANLQCNDPVVDLKISQVIPSADYDGRSGKHDIALIRLERDVQFTDYVKPICLPNAQHLDPLPNTYLLIAGWGQTENSSNSDYKLRAEVPVQPREICTKKIRQRGPITDDQICAGGTDGKDTCAGDSGGPLMGKFPEIIKGRKQFYQEGVVAWGVGCGITGFPAIYTRVSKHVDWIIANIKA